MEIAKLLAKGLPVPKQVLIPQATVDDTGRLYVGLGWQASPDNDDLQGFVSIKWRPSKTDNKLATAIVNGVNTFRAEVSDSDDTPGVFTLTEGMQTALGSVLGK